MTDAPVVTRVRHELTRRRLTVRRRERLAPHLVRIVLGGTELAGFTSLGFDDHVKMFFPARPAAASAVSADGATPYAMRDFTPRRVDLAAGELWIDFFLHAGGEASAWAAGVAVGDSILVGGPKGSAIVAADGIDSHVFIGDETAVPAISRRLEELPAGARALVVVEVDDLDWPAFPARASLEVVWVRRGTDASVPSRALLEALRSRELPPGRCYVWVALESKSAQAVRRYLREERRIGKDWIKAAGYWQRGAVGVHTRIEDDA